MEHLGRIAIVEPDPVAADAVSRECSRLRRAQVLRSAAEAQRLLDAGTKLTALITEHELPDGTGLQLVSEVRKAYPLLPVLVLTAHISASVINRCQLLRAEFVAKPARRRNLNAFLRRSVAFERVPDRRVAHLVDELVQKHGLSPRETDVLAAALQGTPRRTLADQIGTTENTVKSCVKSLLRKCDQTSLDSVVRLIFTDALAGSEVLADGDLDRDSAPPPSGAYTIPPPADGADPSRH